MSIPFMMFLVLFLILNEYFFGITTHTVVYFSGKNYSILSMKTTLAHVLRAYRLSTDLEFVDIKLTMNVELTIENGFPIRFEKRG